MRSPSVKSLAAGICLFLSALLAAGPFSSPARAHTLKDEQLASVGVDERPGAQLPLDLPFTDQDGRQVRLGDYFTGGPVILTLNYYSCPTLCPVVFRNLAGTVTAIKGLSPAKEYRIVTVSIDPEESTARARAKAAESWRMLPQLSSPERNWPFLLGDQPALERLAKSVGVRYVRLGKNDFAHPSVILVVTPDGRVSRYLYGLEQRPVDLKLALIEAAGGRIGGSELVNRALLYCFHYDPAEKKYLLAARNIMTGGGIVTLFLVGVPLALFWRRERMRRREATTGSGSGAGGGSEKGNR